MINENILKNCVTTISPDCYAWFRAGNKLVRPSLTTLINRSLSNPMGYYQFIAYRDTKLNPVLFSLLDAENENENK